MNLVGSSSYWKAEASRGGEVADDLVLDGIGVGFSADLGGPGGVDNENSPGSHVGRSGTGIQVVQVDLLDVDGLGKVSSIHVLIPVIKEQIP